MRKNITFKKLILLFLAVSLPVFLLGLFLIRQNSTAASNRTFSLIQDKVDLTAEDQLASCFKQPGSGSPA